jgi:hypothetical protein
VRVGGQPLGDGVRAEPELYPPGEDRCHGGCAVGVQDEAGFGAALGGFVGHGVGHAFGGVPVWRGADVPPGQGVFTQPAPCLLFDLRPEPLGHTLLDPAHEHSGRVGVGDVDRLVGGEQRDPGQCELLLQLEGVVGVAAGSLDVLADHRCEPGHRGRGFGEQVGQSPITRDADADELLVRAAVATCLGGRGGVLASSLIGAGFPGRRRDGQGWRLRHHAVTRRVARGNFTPGLPQNGA